MNIKDFYNLYQSAKRIIIDSRTIDKGDLFFAFSGENFNAATQAQEAINKGAIAVIVEQKEYENQAKNIFYVQSTLQFLQDLAKYHREQLKIPIIALTGSNGKTTTKELISAVLAKKYNVQYTFGNLNNHIGVPLTLLSIKKEHQIAVVEMGANHQKEIEQLCEIAKPDYGYITNFGKAHLEGFGGFEGVVKGKSELYDFLKNNQKTIVYNASDALQKQKTEGYEHKISFGIDIQTDYAFQSITNENYVGITFNGETAFSQLTGEYNFNNLCAAATFGLMFNTDFSEIKQAIEEYTPNNMRSQVVQKQGKTLVLDTYNANPSSMEVSLRNFSKFQGSKTVILGDMLELGEESRVEHQRILELAQLLSFEQIFTVGEFFKEVNSENSFLNTEELINHLSETPIQTKNILIKGSRGIALEKTIEYL